MPQNSPASNTNKWYLSIDGYDISGKLTELDLSGLVDTEDITAGSGTEHVQRAPKLRDTTAKLTIAYIEGAVPQYITNVVPGGVHTVVSCPEGNVSGKPMHKQVFIFKKTEGPKQTVKKDALMFKADLEAADAPMVDIYKGGTVP